AGWEGSPEPAELSVGASSAARGTRTKGSRAEEKARKREEARLRAERNKGARPLEKKIAKLEAEIAELEGEQTSCSEALSDPRVYDDAARRDPLLERIQYLTASIEKRTAQWVAAQEELEALEPASAS
ncbi:MAG: ABC transporter ATP-binding protein, partial [Myxococcales bacterium]|nr:ABC transporter ATP-binding protein [Myxococcales bacterium]